MRFNRSFIDSMKSFRLRLGEIKANHAARGLLMSGATIKRGLVAYSDSLEEGISVCLEYIAVKSQHNDWKRGKLLELLEALLIVYADRFSEILDQQCVRIAGGGGAASEEAEVRRRAILDLRRDQISKFKEGIGLPRPENWSKRHPFLTAAIIAVIGIAVAKIVGSIGFSN